jgi:hypothetical protein
MDVRGSFERVVRASARRPRRVLAVTGVLAALGALGALRLEPSAATSTLAGRSSDTFQATERYRERFGDHSVVVLVQGDLPQLVLTENLGRLLGLEGCLSGNKPPTQRAPGGPGSPCDKLAQTKPVQVVYGPGTFINAAVGEIQDQLRARLATKTAEAKQAADAARRLARARGLSKARQDRYAKSAEQLVYAETVRDLLQLNLKYGLSLKAEPRIDDPDFVSALVFDPSRGATTPKARFAYLFPSRDSAAIQVRLKPNLSDAQRSRAIALVRDAVGMKEWRLRNAGPVHGDRRAGRRRGPRGRARGLDAAAARRRARGHGRRAGARVPAPAAARPAAGRAGCGGGDVRADVARRRPAHDGVDRGAARPARPRRRLRDPVAGARGRGPAGRAAGPRRPHRRPPTIATAALATGGRLPRAAALPGPDGA